VELKQTKTGQNEDQQGEKRQSEQTKRNEVKQIEKITKKQGNRGWDCAITAVSHPVLLVSVQPILRN
jgi:hypothetical protein